MIRRWSHLNNLIDNLNNYRFIEKRFKLKIFRKSVNYRKYSYKITKFKRKSLIRFKHTSNWLIYSNVIKLWSKDYIFNKHYAKFQYFNNILINNFFLYDFTFIKNKNEKFSYNFNFFISIFSKKFYFYLNKDRCKYIYNTGLTRAWIFKTPFINDAIVPFLYSWDSELYAINQFKNNYFCISSIFDFFFLLYIYKNLEIAKILNLLFYAIIFKR